MCSAGALTSTTPSGPASPGAGPPPSARIVPAVPLVFGSNPMLSAVIGFGVATLVATGVLFGMQALEDFRDA